MANITIHVHRSEIVDREGSLKRYIPRKSWLGRWFTLCAVPHPGVSTSGQPLVNMIALG
ncbi:MAG: hypothetical protein HOH35_12840 [Rhodobacteraceae bacterium]|nr:hypothetical protein [Paracoccaceae bacterium]